MLIDLAGRSIYYDLAGPEDGPVVCFTHSLASDGGMWAEQVPPLLAEGYRVLRLEAELVRQEPLKAVALIRDALSR